MLFDRRGFLGSAAASLILPAFRPARASNLALATSLRLVEPILNSSIIPKHGWRPRRAAGFRLEVSPAEISGKRIVNNYGHGGAGITLSWGCAKQVLELISQLPEVVDAGTSLPRIGILGAGVIGLTTATLLLENHFDVTIYAQDTGSLGGGKTTSDVAGGQFAPSVLGEGQKNNKIPLLRAVNDSYDEHLRRSQLPGASYGVHRVDNYTSTNHGDLQDVYDALYPRHLSPAQPEPVTFSIGAFDMTGYRYATLLIEVSQMMAWLRGNLRSANRLRNRTFRDPSDLNDLDEHVLVNCLGAAGPRISVDDASKMDRLLGIVAFLPPQPNLHYLLSGAGYIFPRDNELVVGGWLGRKVLDDGDIDTVARKIVAVMSQLFMGGRIHDLPDCFSSSGTINALPKKSGAGESDEATNFFDFCE